MNVWITDEPYPTSDEVLVEAEAAGATQIFHGIPQTYEDIIPAGTLGLYELVVPEQPIWPSLDSAGALATLLVVLNVIPLEDAANAIHEEPDHLIAEAEAWGLG